MSFFERGDDANNLGKKPEFRDLENFADPDAKIVQDLVDERAEAREKMEKRSSYLANLDLTPPVWEGDVKAGKYDPKPEDYELKVVPEPTITSSFKTQDRVRAEAISKFGQGYKNPQSDKGHMPRRQKPKPSRDSIRFDEAV
ncbi:MAG: hypothetical protein WCJ74_01410 [bacterium]